MVNNRFSKITFAIPVKDGAKTILYTLKSIESLLKKGSKVIISINKSSDNTYGIINNFFKNKKINPMIIRQRNLLLGMHNHYEAIKRCKTKYLCLLGCDDVLLESKNLLKLLEIFENDNNIGAVSFKTFFVNSKKPLFKINDRSNISLNYNNKYLRWINFFINPGANSRYYSIYRFSALIDVFPKPIKQDHSCFDIVFVIHFLKFFKWQFTNSPKLKRGANGESSNMIIKRMSNNYYKIWNFFPSLRLFEVFKFLNFFESIFIIPFIFSLYMRYTRGSFIDLIKLLKNNLKNK